jgi:hypothetical protein
MDDFIIRMSDDVSAIAKALILAQGNMGMLKKNAQNQHFQSKYADLGNVLDVALPALNSQGIALLQAPGGDGATIAVETMLLHESGQFITGILRLKPSKADPQGAGSAVTYGRRYGAQAMCGLAAEDDDGNAASAKPTVAARKPAPIAKPTSVAKPVPDTQNQRVYAMTLCSKLGFTADERYDFYESVAGYTDSGEPIRTWEAVVAAGKASRVIDALKSEVDKLVDAGILEAS